MIDFKSKKFIVLDLDGTLYAGKNLFPYTGDFLKTIRETGRKPVFLTNNSSRGKTAYFEKLSGLGIAENQEEIYTSGTATVEYLRNQEIKNIYLMATPSMTEEFNDAGFTVVNQEDGMIDKDGLNITKNGDNNLPWKTLPQAVVLTFDTTFNYEKFCVAHDLIAAGVPFYATHPDNHVPLENGIMHPDIGTFISAFKTSTGKNPVIVGKPEKHIYEQLRKHLSCGKEEMVMIGDRLNTDILGANKYGMDSILVLSGETTKEMLEKAPKEQQPTLVTEHIGALINSLNGTL